MPLHPITATIASLTHDGRGITNIEGKTTFVNGALPGEQVTLKITRKNRRHNEAEVIDILTPSPDRITPICPHAAICGGCSMQHVHDDAQVAWKTHTLREQLQHFGKVTPDTWLPPLTGQTAGYRRKARLGVRYVFKKEKLLVGFREKSSNYLADITNCMVLDPRIGQKLLALSACIRELDCYTEIPQVEVAADDHTVALVFRHMTDLSAADLARLRQFGETHHFQIWLQPNAPAAIHKLYPETPDEWLHYPLTDFDLDMRFHPLDFTQVNHAINPRMIQQAIALLELTSQDDILDLFCGLGNFTLPIARYAKHVTGIEGSQQMVNRATENAARNHITNTHFIAANLMAPDKKDMPWLTKRYDKILLDPPRSGAKEIIPFLPATGCQRIVYVSCHPATLARDAGELVHTHGYHLAAVGAINMFPHTSHIEAIALFTLPHRKGSNGHHQHKTSAR